MINEIKRLQQLAGIRLNELNDQSSPFNLTLKWINPDDSDNGNEIEVIYNGKSFEEDEHNPYYVYLWTSLHSNEDILGINITSSEPSYGGGYDDEEEVDWAYERYENELNKLNSLFKHINKSDDDTYVSISKHDISNWDEFISQIQ